MSKTRVFVDTNVIIEANRTKCWSAICNRFSIETVEKCIEESLTGNTPVSQDILLKGLSARHVVNKRDIANLFLSHPECQGLDAGELHLLSWLFDKKFVTRDVMLISTADKAALRVTGILGWLNSLISLEELVNRSGVTRAQRQALRTHYSIRWLADIKREFKLNYVIIA